MKYFFFDIDGTLSDTRDGKFNIPDSTKLALRLLKENGHFIAISTGRGASIAMPLLDELGFDNMVSDGGNGIVIDKKIVEIAPIDKDLVCEVVKECESLGYAWALQDELAYKRKSDPKNYEYWKNVSDAYENIPIENYRPENCKQIYKGFVGCQRGLEEKMESLKKIDWVRFRDDYLFVEPCNKAFGIKKMVDYLHGDYKDVVVFGDEKNDLSMFIDGWMKIAMGNAIDELKQKADYITDDVTHDGIYNACKKFGWI